VVFFDNGFQFLAIMKVNIYKSDFNAKIYQKDEKIIEIKKTY